MRSMHRTVLYAHSMHGSPSPLRTIRSDLPRHAWLSASTVPSLCPPGWLVLSIPGSCYRYIGAGGGAPRLELGSMTYPLPFTRREAGNFLPKLEVLYAENSPPILRAPSGEWLTLYPLPVQS